jgi:hypothetical protein
MLVRIRVTVAAAADLLRSVTVSWDVGDSTSPTTPTGDSAGGVSVVVFLSVSRLSSATVDDRGLRVGAVDWTAFRSVMTCWDEDWFSPRVSATGRRRLKMPMPATITTHPHTGVAST